MRKIACLVALASFVLVPASVAGAAGVQDTYRGGSQVLGEIDQVAPSNETPSTPAQQTAPATAAPQQEASGSLPFTGTDAVLVALGGALLLGAGFGLRRLSTGHDH